MGEAMTLQSLRRERFYELQRAVGVHSRGCPECKTLKGALACPERNDLATKAVALLRHINAAEQSPATPQDNPPPAREEGEAE